MPIRFRCNGCGRRFQVRDEMAGKAAECRQCGNRIRIPTETTPAPAPAPASAPAPVRSPVRKPAPAPEPVEPDIDVYGLNDGNDDEIVDMVPTASGGGAGGGGWATRPIGEPRRVPRSSSSSASSSRSSSFVASSSRMQFRGIMAVVFVVLSALGWVARIYRHTRPLLGPATAVERNDPFAGSEPVGAVLDGPIALPAFPEPGLARQVAPGVQFREVVFGPSGLAIPPGAAPGSAGKLWIYTPAGEHPPRSLPCVLIAPAGSNLITGMVQGDGDRAEHLPYVRAGFAVVAYELDGFPGELQAASEAQLEAGARRFLRARAGLVNAHVAIEYALAKIPEIDPSRLAAVGHSSAGTMAVLFAEHEPRLHAAVAFAPALDIPTRFGNDAAAIRQAGFADLVDRFSPSNGVGNLGCPLLLFHARDDSNVPAQQTEQFAATARRDGKSVTLEIVPTGGHYQSMVDQGIPRAIDWLRQTLGSGSGSG